MDLKYRHCLGTELPSALAARPFTGLIQPTDALHDMVCTKPEGAINTHNLPPFRKPLDAPHQ